MIITMNCRLGIDWNNFNCLLWRAHTDEKDMITTIEAPLSQLRLAFAVHILPLLAMMWSRIEHARQGVH